jgi:glycosyltransferase involved in cell wall biosynthesis
VTIVLAYYENPAMLEFQWKQIAAYPAKVRHRIEIIVVDDASPVAPALDVPRPRGLPPVAIYRLQHDIPWNQDAARNIGAHEAKAPWLLLTDIDHVVVPETLEAVLDMEKDSGVFYTFGRIKFESGDSRDPHPNSYFMTKDLYWAIGGHDEDYAGIYGKDVLFRGRALAHTREEKLLHHPLARVGKTLVVDAGTTTISRKNTRWATARGYVVQVLKAMKLFRGVQTLSTPYDRVL